MPAIFYIRLFEKSVFCFVFIKNENPNGVQKSVNGTKIITVLQKKKPHTVKSILYIFYVFKWNLQFSLAM